LDETSIAWSELGLAVLVSGVTAAVCIHLFLGLIDRVGMWPFVVYRLLLGAWLFTFI